MVFIICLVGGILMGCAFIKMVIWGREENKKIESEDISEHGVDKD